MMSDVRGKMYDVSPPPSDFRPLSLGGLAQLARAPALQAGGQRFESVILHNPVNKHWKRSLTY